MQLSFKFCHRSERAIKPFVLGRKACLFSQTVNGANASATLYSIIETALCRIRHKVVYTEYKTMPNVLACHV
jgi:transposase